MTVESPEEPMSCDDVLRVLSDYLDGELDEGTVARVDEHLRMCRRCDRFGAIFSETVTRVRQSIAMNETLPGDMRRALRTRLQRAIE